MITGGGEVTDTRSLILFSDGLLSKFGFGDGDWPDEVLDWLDTESVDDRGLRWRPVLVELVRTHLLPVLDQCVEVYEIDTSHNPIRASTVNGVEVDDHTSAGRHGEPITLTPESVAVPYAVVLDTIRRHLEAK